MKVYNIPAWIFGQWKISLTGDASRIIFWQAINFFNETIVVSTMIWGENTLIFWDTLKDLNISAATFSKPKLGTAGFGYCRPESTVGNWVSWVFEVDGHEINVVRNDVVQTTELQRWVGEMLIGLWSWDCWGNPLTDHENSTFEWWYGLSTATPKVGSEHRLEDQSNESTTLGKLSCYHFFTYYSRLLWSFKFTNPPQG